MQEGRKKKEGVKREKKRRHGGGGRVLGTLAASLFFSCLIHVFPTDVLYASSSCFLFLFFIFILIRFSLDLVAS